METVNLLMFSASAEPMQKECAYIGNILAFTELIFYCTKQKRYAIIIIIYIYTTFVD